jgi:hypothetical protein
MLRCLTILIIGSSLFVPLSAAATVIFYQDDLPAFESAAGIPVPIQLDFDALPPGTDLSGASVAGVTLNSPDGNSLEVVQGLSTFTPGGFTGVIDADTNVLFPTSGSNVLSPGGEALVPGPALAEMDSLEILFDTPQLAVGLDVLFQSLDSGVTTPTVEAFDSLGSSLGVVGITGTGPGGSPGAAVFIGLVSDDPTTYISRLLVSEFDNNAEFPDSNIGYDTLRFAVPEPGTGLLLLAGLVLLAASTCHPTSGCS